MATMLIQINKGQFYVQQPHHDARHMIVRSYALTDVATGEPVPSHFAFYGCAWTSPFDSDVLTLDDPSTTARPRQVRIGSETTESWMHAKGYARGFEGKRALTPTDSRLTHADWLDGYVQGRKDSGRAPFAR